MKKLTTLILALTLSFTIVGCGAKDNPDSTKDDITTETDDTSKEKIDDDQKNVSVTLPESFLNLKEGEELDSQQIKEGARAQGMVDAIINNDNTFTYIMTKEKHTEMTSEFESNINNTIESILNNDEIKSYVDIKANDDFTEFDVFVIEDDYRGSTDGIALLGLAHDTMVYQTFTGTERYKTTMVLINDDTKETIETFKFPEMMDEIEENSKKK